MINGAHAILYSDVAALQAEGIEIARPISDQSWGLLTAITLPGDRTRPHQPPTRPRPSRPESQHSPVRKAAERLPPALATGLQHSHPGWAATTPVDQPAGPRVWAEGASRAVVSVWNETAAPHRH